MAHIKPPPPLPPLYWNIFQTPVLIITTLILLVTTTNTRCHQLPPVSLPQTQPQPQLSQPPQLTQSSQLTSQQQQQQQQQPVVGISFAGILMNLHEPRIELRYQSHYSYVSLAESSPNNTVVAAVIVNDEDTGPNGETSLAIEQGNELNHFKLISTGVTNTIQVNGAPLSRARQAEYNLTIVARDHGSPPKASSSTLVIKLNASTVQSHYSSSLSNNGGSGGYNAGNYLHGTNSINNGAGNYPYNSQQQAQTNLNSPLDAQSSLKPPVTDLMYVGTMLVVMFSAVIILIIIGCALVQRPQKVPKGGHKGQPPTRTTSASNSRIVPPTDQCSAYCLSSGYDLRNLSNLQQIN